METIFEYEKMGTFWKVTIYEDLSQSTQETLRSEIDKMLTDFDNTFSRFKKNSLIYKLSQKTGEVEVPRDLVAMLRIYQQMYLPSEKKFTPCIGFLMEDVGYDQEYSLLPKKEKRNVPDFEKAIRIIDDTHIELYEPVLLDVGAVGKGYCVDLLSSYLRSLGYVKFLVDGSGDIVYETNEETIEVGLEHPFDTKLVIGTTHMKRGAMCSSATNRRVWGEFSHYVDPVLMESPQTISATWVLAETAAYADALSSVLFFVEPERLNDFAFEYCIMNHESKIKKSQGFLATFF